MELTREDFIYLTTNGYRLSIGEESPSKLFETIAEYVNQCDNNFFAESFDDKTVLHAGMRTEVCTITYEEGLVKILSVIDHTESSSVGEFTGDEEHQILGLACMGILQFCDYFAKLTGQTPHRKSSVKIVNKINDVDAAKITSTNSKFSAWPV